MRLERVMHFNSGNLAVAAKRAFYSVSNESEIEFIDARQRAFYFFAVVLQAACPGGLRQR